MGRFDRWLQQGGRPEELPPALQRALLEVDERYRRQDLPGPFRTYLTARPAPLTLLPADLPARASLPDELSGWSATCLLAYGRALEEETLRVERYRRLRGGADDPELEALLVPHRSFLSFNLVDLLRTDFHEAARRRAISAWIHPAEDELALTLHAAARALDKREPSALPVLLYLLEHLDRLDNLWFSSLIRVDALRLTGRSPRDRAGWALAALIRNQQTYVLRNDPVVGLRRREIRTWQRALEEEPATGERARMLDGWIFHHLLSALGEAGRDEEVERAFLRHRETILERTGIWRLSSAFLLLESWRRRGRVPTAHQDLARELLGMLERHVAGLPPEKRPREERRLQPLRSLMEPGGGRSVTESPPGETARESSGKVASHGERQAP